jgi:beta-lactamase class A
MVLKSEQQRFPGVKPVKKKERKDKRSDGRKAIVVLFVITVLASVLFYLQAEVPKIWERITAPAIISKLPQEKTDTGPVLEQIEDLTEGLVGTYGVYVYRFEDGVDYGLNEKRNFPAASLNKLPVMIAAYQQAEQRELDLETEYSLNEKDKVQGAGVLQSEPAGTQYTYRQLLEYMGQYSDNTAFKVMRRVTEEVTLEQATPEEIGDLFRQIYEGELINQRHQEELLRFLTETDFEDRIPQGVPEGVRVVHKIGTLVGVYSDAGIVYAEKPFVLVIMTKDAREGEALGAFPLITQIVWDFETGL